MPWPSTQRATTRQRILDSAARLFAQEGFEQVSIDVIMRNAGLTRGAFYHHFASKKDLYNEALRNAARAGGALLEQAGTEGVQQMVKSYLRMEHRDGSQMHCPLAFMVNDAARQDEAIRSSYTRILAAFVTRLESGLESTTAMNPRRRALQIAVGMIGGVALARAVDDDQLAEEILAACQTGCLQLMES
ncbi:TetR/AcrR family transcriptional regulator [Azotobacter armeniacus]